MTINNTAVRTQVQGNSAQTVWNYNFEVPAPGDAQLWLTQISTDVTVLVSPTLFTMTGIGSASGGTFTYPLSGGTAISNDFKLTLVRTAPYANLTALGDQSGYYPRSVENALDFLAMQTQQLAQLVAQCLRVPSWDSNVDPMLSKAAMIGSLLGFDGSGNPIPVAGATLPSVMVTPYMETLLDDANAAAARSTLGFSTYGGQLGAAADAAAARMLLAVNAPNINRLINSGFLVNQRGVSGTVILTAGQYGHDRWRAGAAGCTYTFVQTVYGNTITIVSGTLQQEVSGSNVPNANMILSWSGTAPGRLGGTGFGASPQSRMNLTPSVNVVIEFQPGTLYTPQLEVGVYVTPYQPRLESAELDLCRYYYQRVTCAATFLANGVNNLSGNTVNFYMRAAPSATLQSDITNTNVSTTALENTTTTGARFTAVSAGAGAATIVQIWSLDAEL